MLGNDSQTHGNTRASPAVSTSAGRVMSTSTEGSLLNGAGGSRSKAGRGGLSSRCCPLTAASSRSPLRSTSTPFYLPTLPSDFPFVSTILVTLPLFLAPLPRSPSVFAATDGLCVKFDPFATAPLLPAALISCPHASPRQEQRDALPPPSADGLTPREGGGAWARWSAGARSDPRARRFEDRSSQGWRR